jgi:type IV pilus assembly protein PilY1
MNILNKLKIISVSILMGAFVGAPAIADDSEIFFGETNPQNIVLLLDRSGSMNWSTESNRWPVAGEDSRMDVLQEAMTEFLNDLKPNTRVGAFYFHGNSVVMMEPVRALADEVNNSTQKDELIRQINNLNPGGATPTARSMIHATYYFKGQYGNLPTPMNARCSLKNNMVLVTDGAPTVFSTTSDGYNSDESRIERWLTEVGNTNGCQRAESGRDCMVKLANYLVSKNHVDTDKDGTIDEKDNSKVNVSTIAFALFDDDAKKFLEDVASEEKGGNGVFASANDVDALVEALKSAIKTDVEAGQFVAPSVPLSQSNRFSVGNEIFFATFKPLPENIWPGNVKKYYLVNGEIRQGDNISEPAVDPTTGMFKDDASSAWSNNDGNNVLQGGTAQSSKYLGANVYSNLFANNLTNSNNVVEESLAQRLTQQQLDELFGAGTTESDAEKYFKWISEKKVTTTIDLNGDGEITNNEKNIEIPRFGDPLHSQPVILNYATSERTVFVGTNQGFLHAINVDTGTTRWSFMPRHMFKRVPSWKDNLSLSTPSLRDYGLDGGLSVFTLDRNSDGIINSDDNDIAMLYVGQRRGGKRYYALDVTAPNNPRIRFTVKSDDTDPETVPFYGTGNSAERVTVINGLGQTWSKPQVARIKRGNGKPRVLVFGGGYDTSNDDYNFDSTTSNQKGQSFHILNWRNGRNYSDSIGAIKNLNTASVPSEIGLIDLDNDGLIDTIYFVDIGGKVYRVDMPKSGVMSDVKSGVVANLDGSDNNRFYGGLDVVFDSFNGVPMAIISLGSGYRAHPKDTGTTDRFFAVYDTGLFAGKFATTVTIGNLNNNTDPSSSNFKDVKDIFKQGKKGWFINLPVNEKVLSKPTSFAGNVLFTTYTPVSNTSNVCEPSTGTNKLYGMRLIDSKPVLDMFFDDNDATLTGDDRFITLDSAVGIVDSFTPVVQAIDSDGDGIADDYYQGVCIGNKCLEFDELFKARAVKWREITE